MTAATRPFVDAPVTDLAAAERLARRVAGELGLGAPGWLRVGMNAVFETSSAVIRVGHSTAAGTVAVDLARRLTELGVRVPLPVSTETFTGVGRGDDGADRPLTATIWERVEGSGAPVDWAAVGAAVATLHRFADAEVIGSYRCPSPTSFPWWDVDGQLASVRDLIDDEAAHGLADAIERHRWWTGAAAADPVICHGDVHPGNVVQTATGPVLLDWDLLCVAPVGWDHAPMMTWAQRWGGAAGEYEAFADGYGRSLRGEAFAEAVAELRLVVATLMRVRAGRDDPAARVEAERRLGYWRGDADAPAWHAQ